MTLKSITAGDIMTSPGYTVGPDDPMARIYRLLCTHRISGLSVVDSDRHLMGLVSERDILDAMHPGTAGQDLEGSLWRHQYTGQVPGSYITFSMIKADLQGKLK